MRNSILPERIAAGAESKIGLRESGGSNKGSLLAEFFAADSYDPNGRAPGDDGYPWCAAFVCRIVQLAMAGRDWTFDRPTTPGAYAFENWSLSQDRSTHTLRNPGSDIMRGDLTIFNFSHIGIAIGPPDARGMFPTVEANTSSGIAGSQRDGDGVFKRWRHISLVKTRIRFRV